MPNSRRPEQLSRAGFVIAALLLTASLSSAAFVHIRANQLDRERDRSVDRLALWRKTLVETLNAETGQRGYVITGKAAYLAPYRQARAQVETADSRLLEAYAGDPSEAATIQELIGVQQEKFEELGRVIRVRDTEGKAAAEAIVMDDSGSNLMAIIRDTITDATRDEMLRSQNFVAEAEEMRSHVLLAQGGALFFAGVLGVFGFRAIRRREQDRHRRTHELIVEARYDAVTDLPNRRQFDEELQRCVSRATRTHETPAVFFIDLDGFKRINDELGHDRGDQLLKAVAQVLAETVRQGDFVARLSGDEFAVIMDLATRDTARQLAARLINCVSQELLPGYPAHRVSCSIGIAIFGIDSWEAEELVRLADTAMYASKKSGKAKATWIGELLARAAAPERPEPLAVVTNLPGDADRRLPPKRTELAA